MPQEPRFIILTHSGYIGLTKKGQIVQHATKDSAKQYSYEQAKRLAYPLNGKIIKVVS